MADQRTYKMLLGDIADSGGAGGLFPIREVHDSLDKTWIEIYNSILDGKIPYIYAWNAETQIAKVSYIREAKHSNNAYYIHLVDANDSLGYACDSEDKYPSYYD